MMIAIVQQDIHLLLIPVRGLADEILVHKITGQLYMNGAAVRLKFPMLVVRHGETDGNLRNILSGQVDGPENQLNATGKKQAQQTANNLFAELETRLGATRLLEIAKSGGLRILSSPITRARHTAEAFVDYFRKTSIVLDLALENDLERNFFRKIRRLHFERNRRWGVCGACQTLSRNTGRYHRLARRRREFSGRHYSCEAVVGAAQSDPFREVGDCIFTRNVHQRDADGAGRSSARQRRWHRGVSRPYHRTRGGALVK